MTEKPNDRPERPDGLSLALNFLPVAILGLGAALATVWFDGMTLVWVFITWVYFVPAGIGGAVVRIWQPPEGQFGLHDRGYTLWWLMTQLQMPFNRLPFLEEALRLIPGLYPLWIALWGGQLSPQAFVGPGVMIADRHLIRVGPRAVLGARSGLAGHIALRDDSGHWRVLVASCEVGADAILGGDGGLGPGAKLLAGGMLPAGRRLGPFSRWPRSLDAVEKSSP